MHDEQSAPLFELFWENSKLNKTNIGQFAAHINEYHAHEQSADSLLQASADHRLPLPRDPLFRTMCRRRSVRRWGERRVSIGQLGSLFAAFARSGLASRVFPSAGATYALEVFGFLKQVEGPLAGKVVYYNCDNHSVNVVAEIPAEEEYRQLINLDPEGPVPPLLFVLVLMAGRTTAKYGERGGRFALLEAGQAIQNLALRLEQEKMAGVEIGGLLDDRLLALLRLTRYPGAKVALGFACGPASRR